MKDQTKNINKGQDEISANIDDPNKKELPDDDSFKTSPRKHRLGWERPLDEQMYESFEDMRENGVAKSDEEAD